MINENQALLNRMHVVLDAIIIIVTYMLAWVLHFQTGFVGDAHFLSFQEYIRVLLFIVPSYLILYAIFNLYSPKRVQGRRLEAWNLFIANAIGLMGAISILYIIREEHISRTMLFIFFLLNFFTDVIIRNIIRTILKKYRSKGYNQKHMILVGYSKSCEAYIDRIKSNPGWGYSVHGILDDQMPSDYSYKGIPIIGRLSKLSSMLAEHKLDEIAITLQLSEFTKLQNIVSICEKSGVHTKFIPDYHKIIPTQPYTEDVLGLPVINIRHVPLNLWLNKVTKRAIDIIGSLLAIIVFSPLMLLTIVLIKTTSKGPLIFKQTRIGYMNRPFSMYKFRSMVTQTEESEQKEWTTKNDPRVTGIGKIIRRTSVDELPQLFNVLSGDMSLIGPRPERPQFVEQFQEEIPRYNVKHQVRPGITGWAQVNGLRGDTSIEKRIEFDLWYIENWTLGLDVKIVFMTVFKGFVNKNAY